MVKKMNKYNEVKHILGDKLKNFLQKPEYVFILLAGLFGIIMIFLMPFFMAPDEVAHLHRAYQVSNGGIVSESNKTITGGVIPIELDLSIKDYTRTIESNDHHSQLFSNSRYFTNKLNMSDQKLVDFSSAAIYSPVAYIPQAIGIKVAQVVYPSLGVMMVLGRLANLAVYILLICIAVRIAKNGKWVYVVVGLFPVAIQQAASLSTDVMTMGLVFIWVALISNMYLQKNSISKKQWITILIIAIGLALTKQTNIVLLTPLLFIPGRIFKDNLHKFKFVLSVFGASALALVAWFIIMQLNHYNLQISKDTLVSQAGQTSFLLQHPLSFILTLWHTYFSVALSDFYIASMHSMFSLLSYRLSLSLTIIGYVGLLLAFMYDDNVGGEKRSNKFVTRLAIVQATTYAISAVAIAGALYLAWTPVGLNQVLGIQGRYFLPLIPLLIPIFVLVRNKVKMTTDKPYIMGILVVVTSGINLLAMLAVTYRWFY